jgi:hypothetical protein
MIGKTVVLCDLQYFIKKFAEDKSITNREYKNNVLLNCAGQVATITEVKTCTRLERSSDGCRYALMFTKNKRQIVWFYRQDFILKEDMQCQP